MDSCVWRYCEHLLKRIDERYCREGTYHYDYQKRNYSTNHVYNMLSTALNTMIDKCECIFFLNTNNSIKHEDEIFDITESLWIYNELSTIKTIRKNIPSYIKQEMLDIKKSHQDALYESRSEEFPKFKYNMDLSMLIDVNFEDLGEWKEKYKGEKYPLLSLYKQTDVLEEYRSKRDGNT